MTTRCVPFGGCANQLTASTFTAVITRAGPVAEVLVRAAVEAQRDRNARGDRAGEGEVGTVRCEIRCEPHRVGSRVHDARAGDELARGGGHHVRVVVGERLGEDDVAAGRKVQRRDRELGVLHHRPVELVDARVHGVSVAGAGGPRRTGRALRSGRPLRPRGDLPRLEVRAGERAVLDVHALHRRVDDLLRADGVLRDGDSRVARPSQGDDQREGRGDVGVAPVREQHRSGPRGGADEETGGRRRPRHGCWHDV